MANASTLVELLRERVDLDGDRRAYTFLADGEPGGLHLGFAAVERTAKAIASALAERCAPGDRALMIYPPGLDFVTAYWGCAFAGVAAVPAYPPDPLRLERTLPRLQAIVADARAAVILTTEAIRALSEPVTQLAPELARLPWLATDAVDLARAEAWRDPGVKPEAVAFLQYTSGSTGAPKGVVIRHDGTLANLRALIAAVRRNAANQVVNWVPLYHDMGLFGSVLLPVGAGSAAVILSPVAFLHRPIRWLHAIAQGTEVAAAAPNFGFDLCVRKTTPEEREGLDLSPWVLALNAAEPVRAETLERFHQTFAPHGFRREAFFPCYGLAEVGSFASGGPFLSRPPLVLSAAAAHLEEGRVVVASGDDARQIRRVVGLGSAPPGHGLAAVDPSTLHRLPDGEIGEIWLSGPSLAAGYHGREDETEQVFRARLPGDPRDWLRTGDLGFLLGDELFITGRRKDLIIIRGKNHYPQDIEGTVERATAAIRHGCVAAFSIDTGGEERLVVVAETPRTPSADPQQLFSTLTEAIAATHDLRLHALTLLPPGTLPKTSSGKLQRQASREAFLADSFEGARKLVA